MPTTTPLTDSINALTSYSNTVTGQSDQTLSEAVATLAAGYGGGGSVSLLDTVTVSTDTREFNLDFTPYTSYDFLLVYGDVTLSAADWLYFVINGSSPSGGTYTNQSVVHQYGIVFMRVKPIGENERCVTASSNGFDVRATVTNNVYIYCYTASNTMLAGSKFTIYGGNYSDM